MWSFEFTPDRQGVYTDSNNNEIGLLFNDLHAVPVLKNLSESINIGIAIFDLKDSKTKNTIVKALQGTI